MDLYLFGNWRLKMSTWLTGGEEWRKGERVLPCGQEETKEVIATGFYLADS